MKKLHVFNFYEKSTITEIYSDKLKQRNIRLFIKRDELIDPNISGNKWRKLKYNLLKAKENKQTHLLTFGGAFSNHIAATAAAGLQFGFQTTSIIRGEEIQPLNPTLAFAKNCGMNFHFVDRKSYRNKNEILKDFQHKQYYILPEGGTNQLALKGCMELVEEIKQQLKNIDIDYWCVTCGTGGTLAGILKALDTREHAIGFSALKGDFHKSEILELLKDETIKPTWEMNLDYHFGGYAKFKPELIDFILSFKKDHKIQLDPIYTGKMFYGVFDLLEKDYFKENKNIVLVHTGGLQGIAGFNQRFGDLL